MNQFTVSLWGDEAWAAVLAQKPLFQIIKIVAHDTSPPLYYFLLNFWVRIFGPSEISIRALSSLFFLLTVLTLYFFGKALKDKKTGFLAAVLIFFNPFLFSYAFEGRMYSLLALTSTLSMYFFFTKRWWLYVLATSAALYTHHFAAFVVLVQSLHLLWPTLKNPRLLWKNFWPQVLVGFLYLPWLYPLYQQTTLVASGFWLGKPNLQSLTSLFESFLLGGQNYPLKKTLLLFLGLILVFRRWRDNFKTDFFLLSWFIFPVVFTFLISRFASSSIFFDRYMLFVIPPFILLLVTSSRILTYPLLLAAIFILAPLNYRYFLHPTKRPFRDLVNYVNSEKRRDDFLLNYNAASHHLFESKYYGLSAPIYFPGGPLPFYTGTALMTDEDVIEGLPKNITGRIGVIGSGDPQVVILPGYTLSEEKRFGSLFFLWFLPKEFTS